MCLRPSGGYRLGTMLNEGPVHQFDINESNSFHSQLLKEGGMSISQPDGGNVGLVNIISSRTGHIPVMT